MKFCVIGLGRFGFHVATGLAENGMEVMAIDSNESIVSSIRDNVTQAICMRISDESDLRSMGVDIMDTVVVAMGENFAQSILVTALLKKHLNVPVVITRAINDIHKEILNLVGADRVILPEMEIGIKLADNLSSPFTDLVRLTPEFAISQIIAPSAFIGERVTDLNLFERYKVHCVGIKIGDVITAVAPDDVIAPRTKLILAGENEDLKRVAKL